MSNPIAFRIEPVYYISIKACGLFLEKKDSPLNGKAQKPSSCNGFGGGLERFPTGQSPVMLHTHEVTGSSPVVSTKKKSHPNRDGFFLFGMGIQTAGHEPIVVRIELPFELSPFFY